MCERQHGLLSGQAGWRASFQALISVVFLLSGLQRQGWNNNVEGEGVYATEIFSCSTCSCGAEEQTRTPTLQNTSWRDRRNRGGLARQEGIGSEMGPGGGCALWNSQCSGVILSLICRLENMLGAFFVFVFTPQMWRLNSFLLLFCDFWWGE